MEKPRKKRGHKETSYNATYALKGREPYLIPTERSHAGYVAITCRYLLITRAICNNTQNNIF